MRRVPGNHRLGGGDAEKVEKVRKMTREAEREEGKEKRSLEKMEHWRCCDETACKTLGSNWPQGDYVDDDDGHAEAQCVNIGWCSPILALVYFSSNTHCFQS